MKSTKITLTLILILIIKFSVIGQTEEEQLVSITVSGSGKTLDEAKKSALRSAIEQAFGTFISSKTEILNDDVISDQITSVASGNIVSFEILNETQIPTGGFISTLKAIVSVNKLTRFVESKGVSVEIKGSLFAMNVKQQMLNEQAEIEAIFNMVSVLDKVMQSSFDYSILSGEPISKDNYNNKWEIPLVVTVSCNKNIDFCAIYCIKTLEALSLSEKEVQSYRSLNKTVFSISINYNHKDYSFFFRKQVSINAIKKHSGDWAYYTHLFTIQPDLNGTSIYKNEKAVINKIGFQKNDGFQIYFFSKGQTAATYSWKEELTLSQIEQLTGFEVSPKEVQTQPKNGGIVVFEENGHGLITPIVDLGEMTWESAKKACDELVLNGYSDWRLPTKTELEKLKTKSSKWYWSNNKNMLWKWIENYPSPIESNCGEENCEGALLPVRDF